jgi:hypothetical protein
MLSSEPSGIYGVMAEFDTPSALVRATNAAAARGYHKMDAYSPFPIEELNHALHLHKNKLPLLVLLGGICGGLTGFLLQWYITVYNFPINIGGRPLFSWPSYIVITFELTVLFASATATFGLLALCGFPTPYHPVFNVPRFSLATRDKFFLCIEAADPLFELESAKTFLADLHPKEVSEVAN